jgi:hypothetical protein
MNKRETGMLVAYVAGACPQQKMNELTPDAWHDILGHLEYGECREAARAVASRQPFVAPSEIIREIADKRSASQPHSNACRGGDCGDCRVSWCMCHCHPAAIAALTKPPTPARSDGPRQLADAMKAITRRPE